METKQLDALIEAARKELLDEWRRDVHKHPEPGFEEVRTQKKITDTLVSLGVKKEKIRTCAGTGLVVDIEGQGAEAKEKKIIALRADMDALRMTEQNEGILEYNSQNKGVAHMCGHDGHMTCLLGFVKLFMAKISSVPSNVTIRLLFQPAEETPGGAEPMIKENCLENVDEVYGMHNWSGAQLGEISVMEGPVMSSVSFFNCTIRGRGGHASQPNVCVDPVVCITTIVNSIQTILSRNLSFKDQAVVSITKVNVGEANNVIPDSGSFGGTVREFDPKVASTIDERLKKIVNSTAEAFNCEADLVITKLYPCVINHKTESEHVSRIAESVGLKIRNDYLPLAASEDFSYFLLKVPGCFFFLGTSEGLPLRYGCHHPKFDWNDKLTSIGVKMWVKIVEDRIGVKLYD